MHKDYFYSQFKQYILTFSFFSLQAWAASNGACQVLIKNNIAMMCVCEHSIAFC